MNRPATGRPTLAIAALLALAVPITEDALAQGCVTARMDSPVPGAGSSTGAAGTWDVYVNWRYFKSDRHFVGPEEQHEREAEGSEVINTVHQAVASVRYNFTDRWSVTLGIPYLMAERSNPIRDEHREVVDRSLTHASGIGDVTLTARRWMLDPHTHHRANLLLGLGIKLPTGDASVVDSFRVRRDDGAIVQEVRPVDQSVQPGDGAFGALLDAQAFWRLGDAGWSLYASGGYLFNPRETSYLQSGPDRFWSVPDQYVVRWGASFDATSGPLWGASLGGRIDGVPAEDVFGSSEGRRRPGYVVAIDPSARFTRGATTVDLSVPIAVYRNRTYSLDDRRRGRNGDAAFADYNLIFGVAHRFD